MKSALFVDFDNVYTQLRQLQPDAAERFARQPTDWMRWLTQSLELPLPNGEGAQRRLLVRRCYLNPNWYQSYRHAFLRAGFEIVDCPPVTSQGKTSTDIHMVLDVIDLLQHETRYDEFIVFSADADFTPVLRKLRRHDRRTTVLAIGFPSAAYQASADLMIDERLFIQQGLGIDDGVDPTQSRAAKSAVSTDHDDAAKPVPIGPLKVAESVTGPPSRPLTVDELRAVCEHITKVVESSSAPVPASRLAAWVRAEHPHLSDDWNGTSTFKSFVKSLELPRLLWAPGAGGRLYDPAQHSIEAPQLSVASPSDWPDAETLRLAREVAELTGAPLLPPAAMQAVIGELASDLASEPFELQATVQRVSLALAEQHGIEVARRDVHFLIRGMQLNGHVFDKGNDDVETLTRRAHDQILFLCQREQMVINDDVSTRIRQWLGSDRLLDETAGNM